MGDLEQIGQSNAMKGMMAGFAKQQEERIEAIEALEATEGLTHTHRGIWIPKALQYHTELNAIEKILIAEIDSLDEEGKNGNWCHASNKYFALTNGMKESVVKMAISRLRSKGFIIDRKFTGRVRHISVNWEIIDNYKRPDKKV